MNGVALSTHLCVVKSNGWKAFVKITFYNRITIVLLDHNKHSFQISRMPNKQTLTLTKLKSFPYIFIVSMIVHHLLHMKQTHSQGTSEVPNLSLHHLLPMMKTKLRKSKTPYYRNVGKMRQKQSSLEKWIVLAAT